MSTGIGFRKNTTVLQDVTDEEDNKHPDNQPPQRLSSAITMPVAPGPLLAESSDFEEEGKLLVNENLEQISTPQPPAEPNPANQGKETPTATSTSTIDDSTYHLYRRRFEDVPHAAADGLDFQHLGNQYQRPGLMRLKRVMGPTVLSWFIPFTRSGASLEEVHHSICGLGQVCCGSNKAMVYVYRNIKSCAGLLCSKGSGSSSSNAGYQRI